MRSCPFIYDLQDGYYYIIYTYAIDPASNSFQLVGYFFQRGE